VSMAPNAGRRLWEMAANTRGVLAIEWLAACQGLDFREGRKSSAVLEQARALLRDKVAFYDRDRYFAPDIEAANALLLGRSLSALLPAAILPSYA
ncbi:MAG: aromatic amino acid lyase, partial [Thauera sp.]|nr:aromatic amino acid lyase [Thauera sp.]